MKALILSAGQGTRLQPLTHRKPKVMMRIGGKPILWYHIQALKRIGVRDIWINLHWLPDSIQEYFGDGSEFDVKISYSVEKELLGTSGALKNPDSGIETAFKEGRFIVAYGDVLSLMDYKKLIAFHDKSGSLWTEAVHHSEEPWTKGVVEMDQSGRIIRLIEKGPKEEIKSDLVRAGFMICEPEILNYIPEGFSDFGKDIGPKLIRLNLPMYAMDTNSYSKDIGTPDRLKQARADFKAGKLKISS